MVQQATNLEAMHHIVCSGVLWACFRAREWAIWTCKPTVLCSCHAVCVMPCGFWYVVNQCVTCVSLLLLLQVAHLPDKANNYLAPALSVLEKNTWSHQWASELWGALGIIHVRVTCCVLWILHTRLLSFCTHRNPTLIYTHSIVLGYLEGVGEVGTSDVQLSILFFPSQCEVVNTPQQLGSETLSPGGRTRLMTRWSALPSV